jgi:glycerol-3-phosphate O-acyltransferase
MEGSRAPKKAITAFLERRVLEFFRLWLRPTFINNNPAALALTGFERIFYVLDCQSSSDLRLLEIGCHAGGLPTPLNRDDLGEDPDGNYLFLRYREGLMGRSSSRRQAAGSRLLTLTQLADVNQATLVPVSFYWGHQPDRALSLWRVLLSDQWAPTSRLRKLLSILFMSSHILVKFGTPMPLQRSEQSHQNLSLQVKRTHRLLRRHFKDERQSIIGPDLSHRRTLLDEIIHAPSVQEAINSEAENSGQPRYKLAAQAYDFSAEIASDLSYRVIRFFHLILTWFWNRLYDGIETSNLDRVRTVAGKSEMVYVPCHRSHIDYLLLSYVLYHNGLALPHIAAGINLNLFFVGSLLRRAGAFFMRRSFRDEPVYKAVFDEYVRLLLSKGFPIEYFIEGGRSRTGIMLSPRPGMINMTVNAFYKDPERDIHFIPVYFSYERLLEIDSYLEELSGQPKKTESLLDIFRVLQRLKLAFGQVAVNFGHPISLQDFLGPEKPLMQPLTHKNAQHQLVDTLGSHIAHRINAAIVVNPTQLFATVLLGAESCEIDKSRLIMLIRLLEKLLTADQFSDAFKRSDVALLDHVIATTSATDSPLEGLIVFDDPDQAASLAYYRNSILHLTIGPALVANLVLQKPEMSPTEIAANIETLAPLICADLRTDFSASVADVQLILGAFSEFGLIDQGPEGAPSVVDLTALTILARSAHPLLYRQAIALCLSETDSVVTSANIGRVDLVAGGLSSILSAPPLLAIEAQLLAPVSDNFLAQLKVLEAQPSKHQAHSPAASALCDALSARSYAKIQSATLGAV